MGQELDSLADLVLIPFATPMPGSVVLTCVFVDFLRHGSGLLRVRHRLPHHARHGAPHILRAVRSVAVGTLQRDRAVAAQGRQWQEQILRGHAHPDHALDRVPDGVLGQAGDDPQQHPVRNRRRRTMGVPSHRPDILRQRLCYGFQVYPYPQDMIKDEERGRRTSTGDGLGGGSFSFFSLLTTSSCDGVLSQCMRQ